MLDEIEYIVQEDANCVVREEVGSRVRSCLVRIHSHPRKSLAMGSPKQSQEKQPGVFAVTWLITSRDCFNEVRLSYYYPRLDRRYVCYGYTGEGG